MRSACSIFVLLVAWLPGLAVAQDYAMKNLLIEGEGWQLVAEGFQFTEGPAADAAGNVYFTDIPNSRIHKVDLEGKVTLFAENTSKTNGLMFGPDGRLYGCRNGRKEIVAYTLDAKETVLATGVDSNDLVINGAGDIYFTDPPHKRVWFLSKGGKPRVVAEGFSPNGIILWKDQGTLVVTDGERPILRTFRIETDGNLSAEAPYYAPLQLLPNSSRPGSDGMKVDSKDRLYVATAAGLQVFDPIGRLVGTILKPQPTGLSNVCFGGPGFDTLFVTSRDKIYKRKVSAQGVKYLPLESPKVK